MEVEEPSLPSAQMWALLQDSVEVQRIAKPRATDSVILIRDFHQVLNRCARVPPPRAARIPQPNVEVLQRIGAQVAQITIYCGPNSFERTPLIEGLVDGLLICRDKTGRSGKASIAYALCSDVVPANPAPKSEPNSKTKAEKEEKGEGCKGTERKGKARQAKGEKERSKSKESRGEEDGTGSRRSCSTIVQLKKQRQGWKHW